MDDIHLAGLTAEEANARADALFRFVMLYHDFAMEKKNYGTGVFVSMAEAHTLLSIAKNPGITVSELAQTQFRTKSAISQILKKLENLGYLDRRPDEADRRVIRLFPTEKGWELNAAHMAYDTAEVEETFRDLYRVCPKEDLDAFFRVTDAYLNLLREEKAAAQ